MKRILLVGAMLFAAGCGGSDTPAPWACPVADTLFVDVSIYVEMTYPTALSAWTDTGHQHHGSYAQPDHGKRYFFWRHQDLRGAQLTLDASFPNTYETVILDRNCDLLVTLEHEGDDPLPMDVRWIKRVE